MAEKKPSRKSSSISKVAACFLITVNLLVMICCSLLFAFSLWIVASPGSLSATLHASGGNKVTVNAHYCALGPIWVCTGLIGSNLDKFEPVLCIVLNLLKGTVASEITGLLRRSIGSIRALLPRESFSIQSGVGLSAVATFIFFVSFMGFYGAVSRSQFLLFMYSTLILLLLLLECALLFYFTSNVIEKGLLEEDGQWAHYTRLAFACCDFNSSRFQESEKPPWSCCGTSFYPDNCTVLDTFPKDCKPTISNWLDRYGTAIYASLAVLHIILSSCSLVRRSRSASCSHS